MYTYVRTIVFFLSDINYYIRVGLKPFFPDQGTKLEKFNILKFIILSLKNEKFMIGNFNISKKKNIEKYLFIKSQKIPNGSTQHYIMGS